MVWLEWKMTFRKTRIRVEYVHWWRPVKLARRTEKGSEFVGWGWGRKFYIVYNLWHGRIAFIDDQTYQKFDECCPYCGNLLDM